MLQSNLIFGIQKKIKEGSKKAGLATRAGVLEESTQEVPQHKETDLILEGSFIAEMYTKSAKAKKRSETKGVLVTESFQIHKAKKKLEKDIEYFNYLNENFVDDVFKDQYKLLLESILNDTVNLYKECDVTPRLISQSLDSTELNESQIVDIYKNKLNQTIKDQYTKPLLKGEITSIYESEIKQLTKKLIEEGSSLDMEQVSIYMPFEETMYQFNKSILIPEIAQTRMKAFIESTTEEYNMFIEESAEDILSGIEKKIKLLTSMISPNMFDASVEAEGVEAPKMAGISIAIDKNFEDQEEEICADDICPAEVAADDDEAAIEMQDDEEASEFDDSDEDIVSIEDEAREDIDLRTDSEDLEDIPNQEEEAEESAAEETAENPEHPGAIEADVGITQSTVDNSNYATNDSDVNLQGEGNDNGEDMASGAELPGSTDAQGEDIESAPAEFNELDVPTADDETNEEPDLSDESVDSEGADEEQELQVEDVSEENKEDTEDKED